MMKDILSDFHSISNSVSKLVIRKLIIRKVSVWLNIKQFINRDLNTILPRFVDTKTQSKGPMLDFLVYSKFCKNYVTTPNGKSITSILTNYTFTAILYLKVYFLTKLKLDLQ